MEAEEDGDQVRAHRRRGVNGVKRTAEAMGGCDNKRIKSDSESCCDVITIIMIIM